MSIASSNNAKCGSPDTMFKVLFTLFSRWTNNWQSKVCHLLGLAFVFIIAIFCDCVFLLFVIFTNNVAVTIGMYLHPQKTSATCSFWTFRSLIYNDSKTNIVIILHRWLGIYNLRPQKGTNMLILNSKTIVRKMFLTQNILKGRSAERLLVICMTFVEWRWQNGPNATAFYCFIQCVKPGDRTWYTT